MSQNIKPRAWTCKEIERLRRTYASTPIRELMADFNRTAYSIKCKAEKLGLVKDTFCNAHVWTDEEVKLLKEYYPRLFNDALAKWFGVSVRTLRRKAKRLGLEKVENFNEARSADIGKKISEGLKGIGWDGNGIFKKGVRSNPNGEFKKGHHYPPELEEKRKKALKDSWARRKKLETIKKKYGL